MGGTKLLKSGEGVPLQFSHVRMVCPPGTGLPTRQAKHRCQAEPRKSRQQHKDEELFFFKNLIFQKISIEVVIIIFSEFLMLFYGLGFFNENYIWEVGLSPGSVTGLEPLKCPWPPPLQGCGRPRTAFSCSSAAGHTGRSI